MKVIIFGATGSIGRNLVSQALEQGHDVTIYTFTLQYPDLLFPGKSQYSDEPAPEHLKILECINSINPLNW